MPKSIIEKFRYTEGSKHPKEIILLYDMYRMRVMEKISCPALLEDDTMNVVDVRKIYSYNEDNYLKEIIEIKSKYSQQLEENIVSYFKVINSGYEGNKSIELLRSEKQRNKIRINSIKLLSFDFIDYDTNRSDIFRLRSSIHFDTFKKYIYDRNNAKKLIEIREYKILYKSNLINSFLNLIGYKNTLLVPIKKIVDIKKDNLPNKIIKVNNLKLNLGEHSNTSSNVHETLIQEDFILNEQLENEMLTEKKLL